ncbi:MAG: HD domain-containing protein [Bacteroidota bacterium]
MPTTKIFNDPVYGFVNVPYGIVFDLIEHPYFQRLRRIKQLSLTHYVYPGALHTRFHHALGALHLMSQTVEVLRSKNVAITAAEAEAVFIAILLHDIGHGPFSHTLESTLINVHHEEISTLFMEQLNEEFSGQLDLAIEIFEDRYEKKFLHQLVSGQLDMDRMDYLNRDSFFTGVHEGVIGYDRIIKMLSVANGELVVEEKGIYSIEKFLIARRLMYWQVYLHKTVLSAEQMLIRLFQRMKFLAQKGVDLDVSPSLGFFLKSDFTSEDFVNRRAELLGHFALLDDFDVISAAKNAMQHDDKVLSFLAKSIVNRKLFKLKIKNECFDKGYIQYVKKRVLKKLNFKEKDLPYLVFEGKESNSAYSTSKDEIKILYKSGEVRPMSGSSEYYLPSKGVTKYYLGHPKDVIES